jgi:hypothetical protein
LYENGGLLEKHGRQANYFLKDYWARNSVWTRRMRRVIDLVTSMKLPLGAFGKSGRDFVELWRGIERYPWSRDRVCMDEDRQGSRRSNEMGLGHHCIGWHPVLCRMD